MPDTNQAAGFAALDITPWSGETPDDVLAVGAREYSVAEAKAIVRRFAEVTTACDVATFVQGFTEDCVVSFNEHAEVKGHDALHRFMAPRFAGFDRPETQFLCRKVLRSGPERPPPSRVVEADSSGFHIERRRHRRQSLDGPHPRRAANHRSIPSMAQGCAAGSRSRSISTPDGGREYARRGGATAPAPTLGDR